MKILVAVAIAYVAIFAVSIVVFVIFLFIKPALEKRARKDRIDSVYFERRKAGRNAVKKVLHKRRNYEH